MGHGLFYPVDALFLLIGIGVLFQTAPGLLVLFGILIAVATLPSVLSTVGTTYVHRASLMYPLLTMLIGYGVVSTAGLVRKSRRLWLIAAIALIYIIAVINFSYLYYFRFPYYNSESFGLSQRVYSRYMTLANAQNTPVVNISASSSVGYYRNFLFITISLRLIRSPVSAKRFGTSRTHGDYRHLDTCPSASDIARKRRISFRKRRPAKNSLSSGR